MATVAATEPPEELRTLAIDMFLLHRAVAMLNLTGEQYRPLKLITYALLSFSRPIEKASQLSEADKALLLQALRVFYDTPQSAWNAELATLKLSGATPYMLQSAYATLMSSLQYCVTSRTLLAVDTPPPSFAYAAASAVDSTAIVTLSASGAGAGGDSVFRKNRLARTRFTRDITRLQHLYVFPCMQATGPTLVKPVFSIEPKNTLHSSFMQAVMHATHMHRETLDLRRQFALTPDMLEEVALRYLMVAALCKTTPGQQTGARLLDGSALKRATRKLQKHTGLLNGSTPLLGDHIAALASILQVHIVIVGALPDDVCTSLERRETPPTPEERNKLLASSNLETKEPCTIYATQGATHTLFVADAGDQYLSVNNIPAHWYEHIHHRIDQLERDDIAATIDAAEIYNWVELIRTRWHELGLECTAGSAAIPGAGTK